MKKSNKVRPQNNKKSYQKPNLIKCGMIKKLSILTASGI